MEFLDILVIVNNDKFPVFNAGKKKNLTLCDPQMDHIGSIFKKCYEYD